MSQALRHCVLLTATTLLFSACEKPVVVTAGTPAQIGGMTFEVADYDIQRIELYQGDESFEYDRPILVLPITVTNSGEGPVTYSPTHNALQMNESTTPLLYVDPGAEQQLPPAHKTPIQGVILSKGRFPKQIDEPRSLAKGEGLTDYYLFELPPKDTSSIVLSIPPSWHRGKTPALIRIPYTARQPKGPTVYAKGDAIDFDGVTFTVDDATTTYIKTSDTAQGEGFSTNPLLKISYTIENKREDEIVYEPNHRAVAGATGARLFSGSETHKRIQFGPTTTPEGQLMGKKTVKPGEKVSDYVLFEQPSEGIDALTLEFPAPLFRGTGLARVALDYTFSTPPLPKELEKKPKPAPTEAPSP